MSLSCSPQTQVRFSRFLRRKRDSSNLSRCCCPGSLRFLYTIFAFRVNDVNTARSSWQSSFTAPCCLFGIAGGALFPKMPAAFFIGIFAVLVPALVGWFAVDLRELLAREGLALSPFPMAWDQVFRRLGSSDELYGLVVTLSDGRKVGGIYDTTSFVSTYPADGDLLIGAPCEVNQETGIFERRIATSYGLYIKRSDVLAIEVRELKSAFGVQEPSGQPPNEANHG